METQFETIEALEQHFADQLQSAGEDQQAQLQVRAERGDALAQFGAHEREQNQQREWRTQLAGEFPYARQEEIRGASIEEMRAAAQASHEHVQGVIQRQQEDLERQRREQQTTIEDRARRAFGPGAGVPQNGAPPSQPDPLKTATDKMQAELKKTTGLTSRQPFDMREAYPEAEEAVFSAIAERQAAGQARRMGGISGGNG